MTQVNDKASSMASQALIELTTKVDAGHSDVLMTYFSFMARSHRYAWMNVLLILSQNPNATMVAGFCRWKDLGRHVRTGEKGIAILVPIQFRRPIDESEEEFQVVTGYKTGYVFDVSQTEGAGLPSIGTVKGDPGKHLEALKSLVLEKGIKLDYADILGGARGISCGGRIVLLNGMDPAEEFSELVHELVHELAHESLHKGERRELTDSQTRELEAEAVAFVVTTALGLENNSASVDYIQLWGGDGKKLRQSLQHVQSVSAEILDCVLRAALGRTISNGIILPERQPRNCRFDWKGCAGRCRRSS
ncbi:DUF1738 domain-containing protein [bacterium]|nr:MAG: DUF1738 domain-containing protein [bacterium]